MIINQVNKQNITNIFEGSYMGFPDGLEVKVFAWNAGDLGSIPGSPEKEMAIRSSTLPWRIPWREEPGGLQSMGLQRVRHDWAISLWQYAHGTINCLPNFIFKSVSIHIKLVSIYYFINIIEAKQNFQFCKFTGFSFSFSHPLLLFFIFPFWLVYMMPNLQFDPVDSLFDGILCCLTDSDNTDERLRKIIWHILKMIKNENKEIDFFKYSLLRFTKLVRCLHFAFRVVYLSY